MSDRIPLTRLPLALYEATGCSPPSYHQLWCAATAGEFPVLRSDTNRLSVSRSDLAKVAEAFGLTARRSRLRRRA